LANQNKELYKQRKAIVEHPYGTIKRQWGFSYITTKKGMQRASADLGLMFTAYNFRRLITILGEKRLSKYLRMLVLCFLSVKSLAKRKISPFNYAINSWIKSIYTISSTLKTA